MSTCKQIIELASTSLETPLPRGQRWQLRLHLLICRHCRRYSKQLFFLQQMSAAVQANIKPADLSEEARKRIAITLQQHSGIEP